VRRLRARPRRERWRGRPDDLGKCGGVDEGEGEDEPNNRNSDRGTALGGQRSLVICVLSGGGTSGRQG